MELEDELRRALRPVDPPRGFDQRVLQRTVMEAAETGANQDGTAAASSEPLRPRPWWMSAIAAAAAVLVMATAGGLYYEHRLERAEAVRATSEFREALSIASEKLAIVQERVNRPRARE
jgi:anti-sigma-K factor RskA